MTETSEMVERVAAAIDAVQLFSRFNDWTSGRVEGCPVEICRYGEDDEDDIVVVARFGGAITEEEALFRTVSEARARAAIEAMREPTFEMIEAGQQENNILPEPRDPPNAFVFLSRDEMANAWEAMIDAALSRTRGEKEDGS